MKKIVEFIVCAAWIGGLIVILYFWAQYKPA